MRRTFQSTRPRGARQVLADNETAIVIVSIHAPAGGATLYRKSQNISLSFNPRARGGRDLTLPHHLKSQFPFQSTRPRGARRATITVDYIAKAVSIHAPAGGATFIVLRVVIHHCVSIHAPAGGATPVVYSSPEPNRCFNPRARGGRDLFSHFDIPPIPVSIHAPAGGATSRPVIPTSE